MKISRFLGGAAAAAFTAVALSQMGAAAHTGNTTAAQAHGAVTFTDSNAKEYKIEQAGLACGGNCSPRPPISGGGCINLYYPAPVICDDKSPVINGHRYARPAP